MRIPNSDRPARGQGRESTRSLWSLGRKARGPRRHSHLRADPPSGGGPPRGSHGGEGTEPCHIPTRQPWLTLLAAEVKAATPHTDLVAFAPGSSLGKLQGVLTVYETFREEVLAQGPFRAQGQKRFEMGSLLTESDASFGA